MKKRRYSNKNRISRVNDEIMREAANIINIELKDPRISSITSVIKTNTTNDLSESKIYVSIMGNKEEKEQVMNVLRNASGYIRSQLASRINLRNTPKIIFILDESLDYSIRMLELINKVNNNMRDDKL